MRRIGAEWRELDLVPIIHGRLTSIHEPTTLLPHSLPHHSRTRRVLLLVTTLKYHPERCWTPGTVDCGRGKLAR